MMSCLRESNPHHRQSPEDVIQLSYCDASYENDLLYILNPVIDREDAPKLWSGEM
jgi:hypothetical protein